MSYPDRFVGLQKEASTPRALTEALERAYARLPENASRATLERLLGRATRIEQLATDKQIRALRGKTPNLSPRKKVKRRQKLEFRAWVGDGFDAQAARRASILQELRRRISESGSRTFKTKGQKGRGAMRFARPGHQEPITGGLGRKAQKGRGGFQSASGLKGFGVKDQPRRGAMRSAGPVPKPKSTPARASNKALKDRMDRTPKEDPKGLSATAKLALIGAGLLPPAAYVGYKAHRAYED
jgi:hypothetical protein